MEFLSQAVNFGKRLPTHALADAAASDPFSPVRPRIPGREALAR